MRRKREVAVRRCGEVCVPRSLLGNGASKFRRIELPRERRPWRDGDVGTVGIRGRWLQTEGRGRPRDGDDPAGSGRHPGVLRQSRYREVCDTRRLGFRGAQARM